MATNNFGRPRIFIDADVLFAASASPTTFGSSLVILKMAEITLIQAVTSEQVITEAERNLHTKVPQALTTFRLLVQRTLQVVPNPDPRLLKKYLGKANPKDLPILVAAEREGCTTLVTFNVRHFQPGLESVQILKPGQFVQKIRHQLRGM